MSAQPTVMPFGRHIGKPLPTISGGYLRWLEAHLRSNKVYPLLHGAVLDELSRRQREKDEARVPKGATERTPTDDRDHSP